MQPLPNNTPFVPKHRQTRPRECSSLTNSPAVMRARRVEGVQSSYFRRVAAGSTSPSIPPVSTSGWRQLYSEMQQEMDRLCLPNMALRPSEVVWGFDPARSNPPPVPTKALILSELLMVCDKVWRYGTFADGSSYRANRSYPFDDSTFRPHDMMIPASTLIPVPARPNEGCSGFALPPSVGVPQSVPSPVTRCFPHPVTTHLLLVHGGFRRTPCFGFMHLEAPVSTHTTTDITNWDYQDECTQPTPPFGVPSSASGIDATTSLAKLIGLYCTCLEVLGHHPRAPPHPTDIFMANCDGFGWRTDSNTVNPCMGAISNILNQQRKHSAATVPRDTVVLLWDTMLTDAGLPMVERSVYNMCTDSLFSCFSSHHSYGCGTGALCFSNITENTDPAARARLVACETDDYYSRAYEPPPIPVRGPLRSPAHILCRGRNDAGCCLVFCPGGIDGPVIALVFVPQCVFTQPNSQQQTAVVAAECSQDTDNDREMQFQSLWRWFHRASLGVVPVSRRHIVVSIGKMIDPSSEQSPSMHTLPRSENLLKVCRDRYKVESEYAKCAPLGFRFVCSGDATKTGMLDPFAPGVSFTDI